jgi:tRNA (cmo5U34)-methyltransferase
MKSSVEEIRRRFDESVERFSNLETGNTAQIDSPLSLQLIASAAAAVTPLARTLLDVGCGAGNYTLALLERLPGLDVTLLDLSAPMLERARMRVSAVTSGSVRTVQGDVRDVVLPASQYDAIVAAGVLHHLREEREWQSVFAKLYTALKPGGSLWIYDLVEHAMPPVEADMKRRYAGYLEEIQGVEFRERVLAWVEREDTPRSLLFQTNLMQAVGFEEIEILHKNGCFAAFGARKGRDVCRPFLS